VFKREEEESLIMKRKAKTRTSGQERDENSREIHHPGIAGRFTCGTGPDEEPENFQVAVRGLTQRGHFGSDAKKIAEACFKALAKI